ncbi:sensor histidine kinase [Actinomadura viridis]|uniref:sensor histidine kinase n=1 Tax=Actinomadura viridis TaxID=58110 RepID=UPI0036C13B2E
MGRARATLAGLAILAVLLPLLVLAATFTLQRVAVGDRSARADGVARAVAAQAADGRLTNPVRVSQGVLLVQVVTRAPSPRVVASSPALLGRAPIAAFSPPGDGAAGNTTLCPHDGSIAPGCLIVAGVRAASVSRVPLTVYAAVPRPWLTETPVPVAVAGGLSLLLVGLTGWVTWRSAGRVLRPVGVFEAELAEFDGTEPTHRMRVDPDASDELARLARTINGQLDRLERTVARQRQFASDASHELRTPVTGLRTRIEVALADPDDTDLVETLREALGDAERLHTIIDDLLALARLDSGAAPARAPLDLTGLVRAELEGRRSSVDLRADLEEGVQVEVNRAQMCRVLVNLLSNAERYATDAVEVSLRTEEGQAVLEVRDDGPGIDSADRERVFERFSRLDSARSRDHGGAGLGLPVAREVAVAHGGSLRVGPSDRGARLVLRLPLHAPPDDVTRGRPEHEVLRPPFTVPRWGESGPLPEQP